MAADKSSATAMDRAGVNVLHTQRVAGYDAVVLEADSPAALNEWLGKHGYTSRPALEKWLAPYIERKWKITAFKLAGDPQKDGGVGARAVRMSFKTDKPFYPYREPEDAGELAAIEGRDHSYGRSLRVYFFGDERVSGTIGDKETKTWPGVTKWSGRVEENRWKVVREGLGKAGEQLPVEPWLTIFDDKSSPRPGTDEVYFDTPVSQVEVRPEPIIIHDTDNPVVPLDLVGGILLLGLGVFWLIRRMTRVAAPQPAV